MNDSGTNSLRIERPPVTLREMVLERMLAAIISGHFRSGERLVERKLCDELGVSRTVVRETIRYLEAEGLVETLPRKGPIVARMDWPLARQIYDIRMLLETSAAAACAQKATPELKAHLKTALADLDAAYAKGDTGILIAATTRFYKAIFEEAGQLVAWEIVQRLNSRISRLRAMTLGTTDRHISGAARMRMIFEAIADNDPEAASEAVRAHLSEASEIARRLLEAESAGEEPAP